MDRAYQHSSIAICKFKFLTLISCIILMYFDAQACPVHASAVLPPEGLMAEADCIVEMAQAERDVQVMEEKLAKSRMQEALVRVRLYKIQAAMAARLVQITDSQVGQALAERETYAKHCLRPHIMHDVCHGQQLYA